MKKIITEYRLKIGLTQRELGDNLGVSEKKVKRWENGIDMPDAETMKKLCDILEIPQDVAIWAGVDGIRAQKRNLSVVTAVLLSLMFILSLLALGRAYSTYVLPKLALERHMELVEHKYRISDKDGSKNYANHAAVDVTMVQLLANPEKYDGWLVRVVGVGNLGFEMDYIALTKEDWDFYGNHRIGIRLSDRATPYEEAKAYNGKYVLVEGIFRNDPKGENDIDWMEIVKVSRYEPIWKENTEK